MPEAKQSEEKQFVDPNNARPGTKYQGVIEQINTDGVCPFCAEQLARYHKNPILAQTKYWTVTDNMYPYVGAKHHVLLIHREHIEDMSEFSPEAWAELQQVILDLCKERDITGGGLIMRFGETKYTGASVTHLHAHLLQSDPAAPGYSDIKHLPGLVTKMG